MKAPETSIYYYGGGKANMPYANSEHKNSDEHRIEPADVTTAAILGYARRGPTWPQQINSWQDFIHWFGPHDPDAHLGYVVEGFFRNGGRRCYIVRIVGAQTQFAKYEVPPLRIWAIGPGSWGNHIAVRVRRTGRARFRMSIRYWEGDPPSDFNAMRPRVLPDHEEVFEHLVVNPSSPDYLLTRLTRGNSRLVLVEWMERARPAIPRPRDYVLLRDGSDGAIPTTADFVGQVHDAPRLCRGITNLRNLADVGLVCMAEDVWDEAVQLALVGHCSDPALGRMALLTVPRDCESPTQANPPTSSPFAAVYYPWLEVIDSVSYAPRLIPPVGHVAAIYARVDQQRGVHRAPANESISGILGIQQTLTADQYQQMAQKNINVIRDLTTTRRGIVIWSALTMAKDVRWRYVQVRRLANLIVRSVVIHTRWAAMAAKTPDLWDQLRGTVSEFLYRQWRQGYLQGSKPEEAFFVRCDHSTMTPGDIAAGRIIIQIGIAPLRPGELYHFQVIQSAQDVRVIEI